MVRSPSWHLPRFWIPAAKAVRYWANSWGPISLLPFRALPPSITPLLIRVPMVEGTTLAIFMPAFIRVLPMSPASVFWRISSGRAP